MFGVCWLLTGVGWPQLFSIWLLIFQQASPGLFPWWRQGSKRECRSAQGFLRLRLRTISFLPHSFGQHKFTRSAQILWGAAKSHCKRCAYREGWKIQAIFAINLPYYLKIFQFHQEGITIIHYLYVPNILSSKYKNKNRTTGKTDKTTLTVGGYNVPFAIIDRSSTQNTRTDAEELNTIYEVFSQQIFMAHFLCMRHYSRSAAHIAANKGQQSLSSVYILVEENKK